MPIPTNQCSILYSFILGESTKEEIEQWIYATADLETYLGADDYLSLISLDFTDTYTSHNIGKLLIKQISVPDYLTWRIELLMQRIIARPDDVHIHIEETYNLYCKGYDFLQKIGMGFGHYIAIPRLHNYSKNSDFNEEWDTLSHFEQKHLLDTFYPEIIEHAQRVLECLHNKTIEFVETNTDNLLEETPRYPEYIDRRHKHEKRLMSTPTYKPDKLHVRLAWKLFRIRI